MNKGIAMNGHEDRQTLGNVAHERKLFQVRNAQSDLLVPESYLSPSLVDTNRKHLRCSHFQTPISAQIDGRQIQLKSPNVRATCDSDLNSMQHVHIYLYDTSHAEKVPGLAFL